MKLSSVFLAILCAIVLVAVLMLMLGVNVHRVPAQGAKLYNAATETTLKGSVAEIRDFACPVSEGEIGSHLMLKTGDGVVQVHLAPGRIMRSHKLNFNVGDQLTIVGIESRLAWQGRCHCTGDHPRERELCVPRCDGQQHAGPVALVGVAVHNSHRLTEDEPS